uniref:ABPAU n=1 Tax=Mus pahari TaxID=10093 RepID=A0A7S5GIS1_MUSPA|nr:ABPAU [Mus pahari]
MKLAGALLTLGSALLLLTSWGDCGICPAIKEDVHLFFYGTSEEYVEYMKQYKDDPEILENTEKKNQEMCQQHIDRGRQGT